MPPGAGVRFKRHFATWPVRTIIVLCLVGFLAASAPAKDVPLTAIVLYDAPDGAAYVQMTGVMLNGKAEVRICDPATKIDKSAYGKLSKMQMKGATSLERTSEGVLMMTWSDKPICVLPENLRFESKKQYTPAELAEQAILQGSVVPASAGQPSAVPALKPGVRLLFVNAPDTELAEYLRAQRAKSTVVWQEYLTRYASSFHATDARKSLADLYEQSAEAAFDQYRKATGTPDWPSLKQAHQQADQAVHTVVNHPAAVKLLGQIRAELDTLTAADRAELLAYRKSLLDQSAGYSHLTAAKKENDQIIAVDANYVPALELQSDLIKEASRLESTLQSAESLLTAKRYDDALLTLGAYRPFAPEVPRVEAVVAAVYTYHFSRAQEFAAQPDWEKAVPEFRKAVETRPDNQEAKAALKDAEIQLTSTRNRDAAARAIEQSKTYAEQKQYIDAYQVLANLSDPQRVLVKDQMDALKADYVTAAVQRAQNLQEVHVPIKGRADEDAARQAYDLLVSASALSDEQSIRLKVDLLSDKISAYYLELAKHYLERPLASGVGLGWCYLEEAQRFKPNLDAVKDEMTRYKSAYQMHAKLSIGVVFRDQTSRRDSVGLADQLADAIATDLESSGLRVKVVRQTAENATAAAANTLQPLFTLMGEINEHSKVKNPTPETVQSKYRVGFREVRNEAWLKASRTYEAAQEAVRNAQREYDEAVGRKKKKEIETAKDALTAAQKQAEDARSQMDSVEQTHPQDVIEPYNYTKTTVDLGGDIELAFRIVDIGGNLVEPTTPLKQENHKSYVLLENVKAEDTEGVRAQTATPDELAFMTDLETQARNGLIKTIHQKVVHLPEKILEDARKHASDNDLDGAAEKYVIYLNATPDAASPEREEARRFLRDHFNVGLANES
ncbi:MAG: hypothetical protein ACLP6G_11325 [Terriglobales bacterium]